MYEEFSDIRGNISLKMQNASVSSAAAEATG